MDLGEADRIVTICTSDRGKVRAVARGVRRIKSRVAGHLEPLTHTRVSVAEGRSLDHVVEAETIQSFRALRENLDRMSVALYLCELIDNFTLEEATNPRNLDLLLGTMKLLELGEASSVVVHAFEVKLLLYSGFGPEMGCCSECASGLEPGDYVYSSFAGGIICRGCESGFGKMRHLVSMDAVKVLRFLQREGIEQILSLRLSESVVREVELLLSNHIRYVLDKDIKSAGFMKLLTASSVAQ